MTETQRLVVSWFANGETGQSSECMALYLAFGQVKARSCHPYDPSDFNRCLKLLAYAPGLRGSLSEMASLSPQWAALIARWDEIEAAFLGEAGFDWSKARRATRTYDLMREVLDAVTA